jgi:hypothetical protein
MAAEMRAMLDRLMGAERDVPLEQRQNRKKLFSVRFHGATLLGTTLFSNSALADVADVADDADDCVSLIYIYSNYIKNVSNLLLSLTS